MSMEGFESIDSQIQGLIKKISIFKKDGKHLTTFETVKIKTHINTLMSYVNNYSGQLLTRQQKDYLKDTLLELMQRVEEVTEGDESESPNKKVKRRLRRPTLLKKTNGGK